MTGQNEHGELTACVLESVHRLEQDDPEYEYAAVGKVMIACVDAGFRPPNVEDCLNMQVQKGRLYKPSRKQVARI